MSGKQKHMLKPSCPLIMSKKKAVSEQIGWVILGYISCLKDPLFRDHHLEFIKDSEPSLNESEFHIEVLL